MYHLPDHEGQKAEEFELMGEKLTCLVGPAHKHRFWILVRAKRRA